jgi:hypothetical protein
VSQAGRQAALLGLQRAANVAAGAAQQHEHAELRRLVAAAFGRDGCCAGAP